MLQSILIENFAVIPFADIDFKAGFNAITGETGAGKSLILNALRFGLGQKINPKPFLNPNHPLRVQLIFDISALSAVQAWLVAQDYPIEDGTCVIRRVVDVQGKTKTYLNGQMTPADTVRQFATQLFQMHGQQEASTLCTPAVQREMLDGTLASELIAQLQVAYHHWTSCQAAIDALMAESIPSDKNALLAYQLEELNALGLLENEVTKLEQRHAQCLQRETLLHSLSHIYQSLSQEGGGILDKLIAFKDRVQADCRAFDKTATQLTQHFESAVIELSEASTLLSKALDDAASFDEKEQFEIEQRLNAIYDMARKHRVSPKSLYEHVQTLQAQWLNLQTLQEKQEALYAAREQALQQYHLVADQVTQARQVAAKTVSKAITKQLQALGMQGAKCHFEVIPQPDAVPALWGRDKIVFLLQTNPGHPALPIQQIASGGELSRISLAIQMTIKRQGAASLFFDEIDAGIGGETGDLLGKTLRTLGEQQQVISITHLPQIAARAHHHLCVVKTKSKSATHTEVKALSAAERIRELARMMGDPDRPEALQHAEVLMQAE